jgi:putative ABC transport system permease protein
MVPLPVANISHHKLRSALSALGVAIGVCMLITLSGLSRGSLEEVADRWSAVDADLIVSAARWADNLATISGGVLSRRDVEQVRALAINGSPIVQRAVPVFVHQLRIAGQDHNVVGVAPADLPHLLGGRAIQAGGRCFDPDNDFTRWLAEKLSTPAEGVLDIPPQELARRGGLEMVIDTRLAKAAGLEVGSKFRTVGHEFTVVGIVPEGAMVRAFMPLSTAQFLFTTGLGRSTLLFVKLRQGVGLDAAVQAIGRERRYAAIALTGYRDMLLERFGILYVYVDAVNTVTLIVAFLFILLTLYTAVLQRTREIAILRSMGATPRFILRQVVYESLMLSGCGAAAGIVLALPAGAAIEWLRPFLTVTLTWRWVLLAAAAALAGGVIAALYPAFCAMRIDVVEALSLE